MTIEDIGIIVGISASVSTGVVYLFKQFKIKTDRRWKRYAGEWTNKGGLGIVDGKHLIELSLTVDLEERRIKGKGKLHSDPMTENNKFGALDGIPITLDFEGKFKRGYIKAVVFRHDPHCYGYIGTVRLENYKKELVIETTDKGMESDFPLYVKLFRPIEEYVNHKPLKNPVFK
jgi:hypothetical protein